MRRKLSGAGYEDHSKKILADRRFHCDGRSRKKAGLRFVRDGKKQPFKAGSLGNGRRFGEMPAGKRLLQMHGSLQSRP
jgi:hypothetical protein